MPYGYHCIMIYTWGSSYLNIPEPFFNVVKICNQILSTCRQAQKSRRALTSRRRDYCRKPQSDSEKCIFKSKLSKRHIFQLNFLYNYENQNTYRDLVRFHPFVDIMHSVHELLERIGRRSTVGIQPYIFVSQLFELSSKHYKR